MNAFTSVLAAPLLLNRAAEQKAENLPRCPGCGRVVITTYDSSGGSGKQSGIVGQATHKCLTMLGKVRHNSEARDLCAHKSAVPSFISRAPHNSAILGGNRA